MDGWVPEKNLEDSNLPFKATYVTDFLYALPVDVPDDKYDWKKFEQALTRSQPQGQGLQMINR